MAILPRAIASRPRLFAGMLLGLVAFPLLPSVLGPRTRAIIAWDLGVVLYLVLAGILFCRETPARMPANAEAQEEGQWTIFWITLAAILFSFAAIFGEFSDTKNTAGGNHGLHVGLVAATLLLSWLMTHVTFTFRYAHEYYRPDGPKIASGLDFPGESAPDYLDFAYFSLVLGMTFQVSDVQINARRLRRLAAIHGLLGFLFNTVIVALSVNIAASLL